MENSRKRLSNARKGQLRREAVSMAVETRKKFGIGEGPIRDVFSLLEDLQVLIARFPSEDPNLSGFFVVMGGKPCIYINTNHVLGRQNYSAAHELCHWQYDTDERNGQPSLFSDVELDEVEYRAECFASAFLIPPDDLIRQFRKNINKVGSRVTPSDVIKLQHYYQVSYTAMVVAMEKAKIVTYLQSRELKKYGELEYKQQLETLTERMGYDLSLIRPTSPKISKVFLDDILDNYKHKRISERKAKSLLDLYQLPHDLLLEVGHEAK
ncbi:hypothetical protein D478_07254 [Brevibacillus agri BAB-2500]|nr:hypothetical protein D478_07254 [Brevibacillus agri BAB-2500]